MIELDLNPFPERKVKMFHNIEMTLVRVFVTLKPSLLDSAGRTVSGSLQKLGFEEVEQVRIGKMLELNVAEYDESRIEEMCRKLLANPVIEDFRFEKVS